MDGGKKSDTLKCGVNKGEGSEEMRAWTRRRRF